MDKAVGKFRLFANLFLLFLLASCTPTQKEQTNTPVSSPPTQKEQTNTPISSPPTQKEQTNTPTSSPPAKEQSDFLRYDGVYKYESTDFVYYLKFFDDGAVLTTSFSLGKIDDGEAWQYLSKDNSTNSESYDESVSKGDYSLSGSTVKFSTTGTSGTIDYTGQIEGNEINCDVYSHINNGQFSETYVFSQVVSDLEATQTVVQAATGQQPEGSPTHQPNEIDKAWKAYDDKDYSNAIKYAQENIDKWESAALKQQMDLKQPPLLGKVNDSEKEIIFGNWALNEVGIAYFIKGTSLQSQGNSSGAIAAYEKAQSFSYARTWNPTDELFWAPADQSLKNISILNGDEFEPPDTEIKKIDSMFADNRFDDVREELVRLERLGLFPAAVEVYYRDMKIIIFEDRWAMTLPAGSDERIQRETTAAYWDDHLGLICESTENYLGLVESSPLHARTFQKIQKINELAKASLQGNPCIYQPVKGEADPKAFADRIVLYADFMKRLEEISFDDK